jgi:phosphatidate cytidylyltransferase
VVLARDWLATELGARVASAVVLGTIVLLAAHRGGSPFALLWLIAAIAVLVEWTEIAGTEPRRTLQAALGAGLAGLTAVYLASLSPLVAAAVFAAGLISAAALGRTAPDRLWGAAGFAVAAVLVLVPPLVRDDPQLGLVGLLWMFAVVWASDISAYFVGRSVGGPKLWPRVSPRKTWSGFLGGLAAGTGAGVLVPATASRWGWAVPLPLAGIAVVSALASLVGQLGDLAESALKRRFGVKDSGRLIPGHGGVMDRLDAFWAVAVLVGLSFAVWRLAR